MRIAGDASVLQSARATAARLRPMIRTIDGFHRDDQGDWIADLSCLHSQHVRHRPPFFDRPWVGTEDGRRGRIGSEIDCPLCDRAELPDGLVLVRTAGPFDKAALPAGLQRAHRVAERTWGRVRVLDGAVSIAVATTPPIERELSAGDSQALPPTVEHVLRVTGAVSLAVDFLVLPQRNTADA